MDELIRYKYETVYPALEALLDAVTNVRAVAERDKNRAGLSLLERAVVLSCRILDRVWVIRHD